MTDIATNLNTIDGSLSDIKTAIVNKGGTVSGNITTFATAIDNIPSGGGTPNYTSDVPLTRVTDDNNNEIGTWYMNFKDSNGNLYKVVLLDAQYRNNSVMWCSNTSAVTNMPIYSNLVSSNVWEAKETATQNTQLILNYCSAGGYTSSACSHCRSKSFVIGGTTYYGQLPNLVEVGHLAKHYNEFDSLDTSASTSTSTNFSTAYTTILSSSQASASNCWRLFRDGTLNNNWYKNVEFFAAPVLEIPLT